MGRATIFCLKFRPPHYFQGQGGVREGGLGKEMVGKLGSWNHQIIVVIVRKVSQNESNAAGQLVGQRWGI